MIVQDWPPNIDQIRKVLPVTKRNIFAFGNRIYSPSSKTLPEWLIEHEKVHFAQQEDYGVRKWWTRFLKDPEFRLSQELPAHRREYQAFCQRYADRNMRSMYLQEIGRRLAAPMYGSIITAREAVKEIRDG